MPKNIEFSEKGGTENRIKEVFEEVKNELIRQNAKWGEQNNTPIEWVAILSEEIGEAAKEALDHHFNYPPKLDWKGTREEVQSQRLENYREELIQIAAVSVQMILSFDRNEALQLK